MAEKPMIVIKKITVAGAGAHGGAWKVAFADFMTGMMAFFLVMWLVSQSEETKESVAEYFATPSIIEYSYQNYGTELTLEKLFLDLVNEPLKVLQAFITPVDRTPNLMAMGHKNIVLHHVADQLGDIAEDVNVNRDFVEFEIEDRYLFKPGTVEPAAQFVDIMEKVQTVTTGLEHSTVNVYSLLFNESVTGNDPKLAKNVAEARADFLKKKIEGSLEHETVDVVGHTVTGQAKEMPKEGRPGGKIKFKIKSKEYGFDKGNRKFETVFGEDAAANANDNIYNQFVDKLSTGKTSEVK